MSESYIEEDLGEVNNFVNFVFSLFEVFAQAFIMVLLIFTFFFRTVGVDGNSMNNTLFHRERLFILNKMFHKPRVKDIVILNTFDSLENYIVKRIIAKEGQTVELKANGEYCDVYVDGVKLKEDYIKEPFEAVNIGYMKYPISIPKGYVFVMGDNRNNSKDSRELGLINVEKIHGISVARIFPISRFTIF